MKIGLVYAMTGEIESLLTQENAQPLQTVAGVPFYQIRPDVIACAGGVSKVNAAMATQLLISLYQPDLVLNAGVAGCFENMPIGSIVLAEGFLQHDVDTTPLGDPIGLVSTVNRVDFPTWEPEHCAALLRQMGYPVSTGRVATGDWFAGKGDRSAWIRDTFRPTLVEMEGGAIAQVCCRNHVKFAAVKSVSDHLFRENNAEEFFDFEKAMTDLGRLLIPLAQAIQRENP